MTKYQAVRGTHDILPEQAIQFEKLEGLARTLFKQFGFHEVRTPTFESLDLFRRSIGETTDIVEKEMYTFEDRGGRHLALRPEGTAGVVRAFIEHHLSQTNPFCKLFYIGPMFRAERPQAGRYREFWQIGAEYFGNPYPEADAELLVMIQTLYRTLGLTAVHLKINSLGDEKCRPVYRKALQESLMAQKADLCEDCQRRVEKNPYRVLDCKIDGPKLKNVPLMQEFLCPECKAHFETVYGLVDKAKIGHMEISPKMVRGLDYYNRTVFEVTTHVLGAQDALAAGGRYDGLVKGLGGPDLPALGFALGSERTLEALKAAKAPLSNASGLLVFVAAQGDGTAAKAFELLQTLRADPALQQQQVFVEGGFFHKKLGAQLTMADRLGAAYCLILGEEELAKNEVTLRSLKASTQERISRSNLSAHLLKSLRA